MSEQRVILEGYSASEICEMTEALRGVQGQVAEPELVIDVDALVGWLQQQSEDDGLEVAVARGSLDASPVEALMAELIRRARE